MIDIIGVVIILMFVGFLLTLRAGSLIPITLIFILIVIGSGIFFIVDEDYKINPESWSCAANNIKGIQNYQTYEVLGKCTLTSNSNACVVDTNGIKHMVSNKDYFNMKVGSKYICNSNECIEVVI